VGSARTEYEAAVWTARKQEGKWWELHTVTRLATLYTEQDKRNEAYNLLAPVYGWFTEGFETPALQDAKMLLDQSA